jgi:hypothetical protein
MFALQRTLRSCAPEWLTIGGRPADKELAWYWNWQDIDQVLERIDRDLPFVVGPNILFAWSGDPGGGHGERAILDAPSCRAIMCHSAWYEAVIRDSLGPRNPALVVKWPYPIWPDPGGPERAEHDLLIFNKLGEAGRGLEESIRAAYLRSATLHYGAFQREELYTLARRSRACIYLCDDESGGLATAEIMLGGCPLIGIERGAPFVVCGSTGIRIGGLSAKSILEAIPLCHRFDRRLVRKNALRMFDAVDIANRIVAVLDGLRSN